MEDIINSLSPIERKVLPHVGHTLEQIQEKSGLDETSVLRALRFLESKGLVKIEVKKTIIVELGVNGIYYKKHALPERTLLKTLEKHHSIDLEEAKNKSGLSDNEFKAALGVLKRKAFIDLTNGKVKIIIQKEELTKKLPEEKLIDSLPIHQDKISLEEEAALTSLKNRKNIVEFVEKKQTSATLTDLGKTARSEKVNENLIEELTPEIIKEYKNAEFRKYDLKAEVPKTYGGKRHFVNDAKAYARSVWLELGFKEMSGPLIDTSFWVFDALFTAQDHPVREMQDTFFIKDKFGKLPESKIVERVKKAHESGIEGSKGWNYKWSNDEAAKLLLRTHTTSLSARTLASLKPSELPGKYFAIGKAFRNETIDWSHGIEFYQTEGIVIDENVTLRHLLGYLIEFYKKMGFEKIRWRPSFFPYTEPSLEIDVWHEEKQQWLELGGAGMFRPEVTSALFGKPIKVLAWGQGLDRMIMDYYKIKDLRELYSNNMTQLRRQKTWMR